MPACRLGINWRGKVDSGILLRRPGDPMNVSSADLSTVLNRILDAAADNLRFAKILVQMGLDPNNITYDAAASWRS